MCNIGGNLGQLEEPQNLIHQSRSGSRALGPSSGEYRHDQGRSIQQLENRHGVRASVLVLQIERAHPEWPPLQVVGEAYRRLLDRGQQQPQQQPQPYYQQQQQQQQLQPPSAPYAFPSYPGVYPEVNPTYTVPSTPGPAASPADPSRQATPGTYLPAFQQHQLSASFTGYAPSGRPFPSAPATPRGPTANYLAGPLFSSQALSRGPIGENPIYRQSQYSRGTFLTFTVLML